MSVASAVSCGFTLLSWSLSNEANENSLCGNTPTKRRSLLAVSLSIALFLLTLIPAVAQTAPPAPPDLGARPYETYDSARENVNLATGNLYVSIPLLALPGRHGHDYSVSLEYNSQTWAPLGSLGSTWTGMPFLRVMHPTGVTFSSSGYSTPATGVQCVSGYVFTSEDGSTHSFPSLQTYCFSTAPPYARQPGYEVLTGNDFRGEGLSVDLTTNPGGCRLTKLDGTWYPITGCPNGGAISAGSEIVEDTNGNEISAAGSNDNETVGRMITFTGGPTSQITYDDSNGVQRSIGVNYTTLTLTGLCTFPSPSGWGQPSGTASVISSVVLPNGLTYTFQYDACGELTKITYPSGGYTRYVYASYGTYTHQVFGAPGTFTDVEVVKKYVCRAPALALGATSTGTGNTCPSPYTEDLTTYSPSITGSTMWNNTSNSVTDPLGNRTVYQFTQSTLSAPPVETSRAIYQGTSTLLRTIQHTYSTSIPIVPITETTILANGLQSQVQTDYFAYDYPKEKREYDWGQGAHGGLLRKTDYTWSTCSFVKTGETVYDGSNNKIANTTSEIDNYTAGISSSGAVQHDSNYNTSFTNRCNVTAVNVWRNTDGATLTTRYQYDDAGNRVSATAPSNSPYDSLTRTTTYSYADVWGNSTCAPSSDNAAAYPTTVTNAAGYTARSSYNSCTGTVSSVTDANSQQTTFSYDLLDRKIQTNLPDGGQTSSCFSEVSGSSCYSNAYPLQVQATQKISSTLSKVSTVVLDGLARVSETQLNSDPDCTATGGTKVDTTYDGAEHKSKVTNPYCTTGDPTYGLITNNYDALGRVTSINEQDGSKVTTTFDQLKGTSNCTTGSDEAGKSRQSCVDGLGRMMSVWEDPSGLNYETDYAYDALNNLLTVTQKGSNSANARVRSFQYDSLSHLTQAVNPESGTVKYVYDNEGNVVTKTAPSPNQPSAGTATVTTTYTYDILNRLTGKGYSDAYAQNPSTPPVTYGYDGVNLSCPTPIGLKGTSGTNVIGRRSAMCYSAGSKSWLYDAMGRTKTENDRFIGLVAPYSSAASIMNGVETLNENTSYNYHLNGDLLTVFYPSPNSPDYEFSTIESAAGRVITADTTRYNVLTNAHYAPTGRLSSGLIGWSDGTPSYAGTSLSNTYNNRLQPVLISATTPSNASILKLTYNFNLGNGTTGSDNGNVIQIANGKDGNRTQNFLYDPLNRIWQAYTSGPNWGETYSPTAATAGTAFSYANAGIDAWGNLTNRSGVTGKTMTEGNLNCPANAQNQLSTCFTYDAAGNLTKNGTATYTYDAESRLIATAGTSYVYDGDGNRVKKCTEGATPGACTSNATGMFYWLEAGGGTLAESDLGGNWTAAYGLIRGQIASRIDLPLNVVHYYFHDHLNTTDIVTDALGNILKESDYYPYGGEIPISGSDSNRYKFTGKERDSESGLDNFGARFDASSIGRFMSPDVGPLHPGDPQSLNRYAYTLNNPLLYIDPDGKDPIPSFLVLEIDQFYDLINKRIADWGRLMGGGSANGPAPPPDVRKRLEQLFNNPSSLAYSNIGTYLEDAAAEQVGAEIESAMQKWLMDPKTQPEDINSSLITLEGLSSRQEIGVPPPFDWFVPDLVGKATSILNILPTHQRELMFKLKAEMEDRLKQLEEEKKKKDSKGKCAEGPGHTNLGNPYLGPPTQTAKGCVQ